MKSMQLDYRRIERTHDRQDRYGVPGGGTPFRGTVSTTLLVIDSIPCAQPYMQQANGNNSIFVYVEHVLTNGTGYVEVTA
jgi:hypothetical protein